jgi:hypothetical protein
MDISLSSGKKNNCPGERKVSGECSLEKCYPEDTGCCLGHTDYTECKNWRAHNQKEEPNSTDADHKAIDVTTLSETPVSWTGNSFGINDTGIIAERSFVKTIGFIGPHNAGKTSLLTMIYTLLLRGDLKLGSKYAFCGSYTIEGWELLAQYLRHTNNPDRPSFPPHTTRSDMWIRGLLHAAFKKQGCFRDILFTDAPGEWFTRWAINENSEKAGSAQWIYDAADAFVFFIDCEGLCGPDRGEIKEKMLNIAQRLGNKSDDRPVVVLWAKADKIDDIHKDLKAAMSKEIKIRFSHYKEFQVSILPQTPDDPLCYKNIAGFLQWIMKEWDNEKGITITPSFRYSENMFLNIRDQYYEYT